MNMETPYLTIGEVAEYLRLSRETLYKYVRRGILPAVKIGRHWRFRKPELDQWLENQGLLSGGREQRQAPSPRSGPRVREPLRVLVVDDDPSIRLILRIWIEAEGHLADIAENGGSAMRLITKNTYDLVFLDVQMPDLNGAQVLGRLQEYLERPPVVLITGYTESPLLEQALHYEVLYILSKPFMQKQVHRLLIGAQAARDGLSESMSRPKRAVNVARSRALS